MISLFFIIEAINHKTTNIKYFNMDRYRVSFAKTSSEIVEERFYMQSCSSHAQCVDYQCCALGYYYAYDPISMQSYQGEQTACNTEDACA